MNVLLTSAGRRNYLVDHFRRALAGRGRVLAADASPDAPTLAEADLALRLPPLSSPEYVDALLALCRRHDVDLVIPLNDLELSVLAEQRDRLRSAGTLAVVSSPEVVRICLDKWATARFLAEAGLRAPKTWLSLEEAKAAVRHGEVGFPLVVKPRFGSGSIAIEFAEDLEELGLIFSFVAKRIAKSILAALHDEDGRAVLIQERLAGTEHGIDVVNDLAGRHVTTFARVKLAMRAGETDRALTVSRPEISATGRALGEALGHIGNLDCDLFVQDGTCTILEMNPRFGGGYPFSHAAGADLPAAMIAWALGENPRPEWLEPRSGVRAAKCDRIVLVPSGVAGDPAEGR